MTVLTKTPREVLNPYDDLGAPRKWNPTDHMILIEEMAQVLDRETITVYDGGSLGGSINAENGGIQTFSLDSNTNVTGLTNVTDGEILRIIITQGASGNNTLTWGVLFKWDRGVEPVMPTTAGEVMIITVWSVGGVFYSFFSGSQFA